MAPESQAFSRYLPVAFQRATISNMVDEQG